MPTLAYSSEHGQVVVSGCQLILDDAEKWGPPIRSLLTDEVGTQEAREALLDLDATEFERATLDQILALPNHFEEWRIGEAIAEHYLSETFSCIFPWPDSRSNKSATTLSGGVDLVGFHQTGQRTRFVFGEVKTSREQAWPPTVVTGRHGLSRQIEGLKAGDNRKKWAIRYLSVNSIGKPWLNQLREALETYVCESEDVLLAGVLVHVSEPNANDLRTRALYLSQAVHPSTHIYLSGIYLTPEILGRIAGGEVSMETAA